MMSKTHLAIGIGAALALTQPQTMSECCVALIGGSIGGILPDCDILDNDYTGDALLGQFIACAITIAVLIVDHFLKLEILHEILTRNIVFLILGIVIFIVLYIKGIFEEHRGFTHSILALLLNSISIFLIYPKILPCFIVGYLSHIFIDLFNKKNVQIFYPLNFGICFKLCYANKTGNKLLMYFGIIVSAVLLLNGLIFHIGF